MTNTSYGHLHHPAEMHGSGIVDKLARTKMKSWTVRFIRGFDPGKPI